MGSESIRNLAMPFWKEEPACSTTQPHTSDLPYTQDTPPHYTFKKRHTGFNMPKASSPNHRDLDDQYDLTACSFDTPIPGTSSNSTL